MLNVFLKSQQLLKIFKVRCSIDLVRVSSNHYLSNLHRRWCVYKRPPKQKYNGWGTKGAMKFSIMTLCIRIKDTTLSMNNSQHNDNQDYNTTCWVLWSWVSHFSYCNAGYCNADCQCFKVHFNIILDNTRYR